MFLMQPKIEPIIFLTLKILMSVQKVTKVSVDQLPPAIVQVRGRLKKESPQHPPAIVQVRGKLQEKESPQMLLVIEVDVKRRAQCLVLTATHSLFFNDSTIENTKFLIHLQSNS
jgi:hypothetical protein